MSLLCYANFAPLIVLSSVEYLSVTIWQRLLFSTWTHSKLNLLFLKSQKDSYLKKKIRVNILQTFLRFCKKSLAWIYKAEYGHCETLDSMGPGE